MLRLSLGKCWHVVAFFTAASLISCGSMKMANDKERRINVIGSDISRMKTSVDSGDVVYRQNDKKHFKDYFWVASDPIVIKKNVRYPELGQLITYNSGKKLPLAEIATDLSSLCNMKIVIEPDVLETLTQTNQSAELVTETGGGGDSLNVELPVPIGNPNNDFQLPNINGTPYATEDNLSLRPTWINKPLRKVLDSIETSLGVSWRYDPKVKTISFYKYSTVTYSLHAASEPVEHDTIMTNEAISSASEGNSVSGSSISTRISITSSIWSELESQLKAIISKNGRYSSDPNNFTVTLTDTKYTHAKARKIFDDINASQLKQILFNIDIFTLTTNSNDVIGVNFNALYKNTIGASLQTLRGATSDVSSAVISDIGENSRMLGTQLFIDAIATFGKVTIVDSFQRLGLNNQITSLLVARNTPYLRSVGSVTDEGTSQSEAALTDLVTGFGIILKPHIIDENRLLLSISIDHKSLSGEFETVDAGNGILLERPDISGDSTYQQAIVENQTTMIISGTSHQFTSHSSSGLGRSSNWFLGGRRDSREDRRITLILVTPTII